MGLPGDLTPASLGALALVVVVAFSIETALGFGATLISVALGAWILPIPQMLPALVPLNLALSAWLAVRYRKHVDRGFLLRRLLPAMAIGMPLGVWLFQVADPKLLQRLFGVFLVLVSAVELGRMRARRQPPPLSRLLELGMLWAGGVVHGAFATGGPMAVYVTSRVIADKSAYRATLCVLWSVLNTVLVASYIQGGELDAATVTLSAWLLPFCGLGLAVGELVHHRVAVNTFRAAVFVALALAGVMLLVGS